MATDGDLFERAVARGLDREADALFIVRRASVSVIAAGKRVFQGPCTVDPARPADGLYEATGAGENAWTLTPLDAATGDVKLSVTFSFEAPPKRTLALVVEGDPAAHAHGH